MPAGGSITTGCAAGDADETRFTFDPSNRLRRIDRPDGSVVTYRYDPFGRRLEKTVSGVTTWFVWDGDQLLGEYDPAGARTTRYAYAGGFAPVQVAYPNGSGGEDVHEVHSNHLETPRMLTASDGSVAWRSYLEAYGRAHVDSASAVVFKVRFPGQHYDRESETWNPSNGGGFAEGSGLHYNLSRYFEPSVGRYLALEPIGQFGLLARSRARRANWTTRDDLRFSGVEASNPFLYGAANPTISGDATGEKSFTAEAYFPPLANFGGRVSGGVTDDGVPFVSLGVGKGFGAAVSYDPNDQGLGNNGGDCEGPPLASLAFVASGSFAVPPFFDVGAEGAAGVRIDPQASFFTEKPDLPDAGLGPKGKFRFGFGGGVTFNLTLFGR